MLEHSLVTGWGVLERVARNMATGNPRVPSTHPPLGASQHTHALHKHSPGFPQLSHQFPWSSNQPKGLIPFVLVLSLWLPRLTLQGRCLHMYSLFSSESPPQGTGPDSITSLPILHDCISIFSQSWLYSSHPASFQLCFSYVPAVSITRFSDDSVFHMEMYF